MNNPTILPLKETSIRELFYQDEQCKYEIPVYQRNYAWEKDEIGALINDVNDSFQKDSSRVYFIGTLVTYNKGDNVFEVIDGQQRLTTIYLILRALIQMKALQDTDIRNKLTYSARKRSDDTLKSIPKFNLDEVDSGIENGYKHAKEELKGVASKEFTDYFLNKVHIIRYMVPRDIDLNHYFEIMNSRGEQLEKHEIVKAQLMEKLNGEDMHAFNLIWESCSEMNVYVQQKTENATRIYGNELYQFLPSSFDDVKAAFMTDSDQMSTKTQAIAISQIINSTDYKWGNTDNAGNTKDTFQPIIDFPNFLLIVLKLVRLSELGFSPADFNLDDKELLNEFNSKTMDEEKIKTFAFTLLKARYLLDNYIVHHSKEEDILESNPWKLQVWNKDKDSKKEMLRNLVSDLNIQDRLVHLLSMFEVSFTARQRKNYLLYCLMYLMNTDLNNFDSCAYADFLEDLAYRYFNGVYMDSHKLSEVNKPTPGSFDEVMIDNGQLNYSDIPVRNSDQFSLIYGDGTIANKGIPLFIFNYMDYKIWKYYDKQLRGERFKEGSWARKQFFDNLGCSDFGQKVFDLFYFSRTRRSLEHYYPQNQATGADGRPDQAQINCFGNFAMIGSEANSSGSDWMPHTKLDHYLDSSKKIRQVSVASLKFMIMMQICDDNGKWEFEEIKNHQEKMMQLLFDDSYNS